MKRMVWTTAVFEKLVSAGKILVLTKTRITVDITVYGSLNKYKSDLKNSRDELRTLRDSKMQNTKTPRQYKNLVSLLLNDKIERQQKHQISNSFSDCAQLVVILVFCFPFYCAAPSLLKDSCFPPPTSFRDSKGDSFPMSFSSLHPTYRWSNLQKKNKPKNPANLTLTTPMFNPCINVFF